MSLQMPPDASRCLQMSPDASRCLQMPPDASRCSWLVLAASGCSWLLLKDSTAMAPCTKNCLGSRDGFIAHAVREHVFVHPFHKHERSVSNPQPMIDLSGRWCTSQADSAMLALPPRSCPQNVWQHIWEKTAASLRAFTPSLASESG